MPTLPWPPTSGRVVARPFGELGFADPLDDVVVDADCGYNEVGQEAAEVCRRLVGCGGGDQLVDRVSDSGAKLLA
jgi:hypothetical protein